MFDKCVDLQDTNGVADSEPSLQKVQKNVDMLYDKMLYRLYSFFNKEITQAEW